VSGGCLASGESLECSGRDVNVIRRIGLALWSIGLLVLIFFSIADRVGVSRNPDIFGHHQLIGAASGMAVAVLGFALVLSQGKA
jgi:hypothetical protein